VRKKNMMCRLRLNRCAGGERERCGHGSTKPRCGLALLVLLLLVGSSLASPFGPRTRGAARRRERPDLDLLQDQQLPQTIERYEKALNDMNRALQVEGLPAWQQAMAFEPRMAFALVARYLQGGYSTKTLGLSGAANTLCGLRRRLILAVGNGELDAGTLDGLHVLWRMVGRWKVVEPNEFRLPVPMNVCNAVIALLIDAGHHGAAVCILLSF
jgi:hypothetical protein